MPCDGHGDRRERRGGLSPVDAHFSGTGYLHRDVQLNIARPDSVVDTATVTTDLFGNFTYDYPLPPPPGVIGPYHLDALGYAGVTLASMDFTDGNVTLLRSRGRGRYPISR